MNSSENLTLRLYIGRKLCDILEKNDRVIREMKTLYPNFENVLFESMYMLNAMCTLSCLQDKQNEQN